MEELKEYIMTGGFLKSDYLLYPRVFHIAQTMLPSNLLPNGRESAQMIHPNGEYFYIEKTLLSEAFGRSGFATLFYLYHLDKDGDREYIEKFLVRKAPDELINRVYDYIDTENKFTILNKYIHN